MKKILFSLLLSMCSVAGIQAESSDFEPLTIAAQRNQSDTYSVRGFSPFTNAIYTGTVTIIRQGDLYAAYWVFADGSAEIGTGVRSDNHLAFVFADAANPLGELNGVQIYEIGRRGRLEGNWTILGSALVGSEALVKID